MSCVPGCAVAAIRWARSSGPTWRPRNWRPTNPRAAVAKLEALLAVFSGGKPTESDRRCLKLASEQLDQLQAKNEAVATADLKEIQRRLDEADQVSQGRSGTCQRHPARRHRTLRRQAVGRTSRLPGRAAA